MYLSYLLFIVLQILLILLSIMNMFLHYYDRIGFEDDDFIEKMAIGIYSSKETTEEEAR